MRFCPDLVAELTDGWFFVVGAKGTPFSDTVVERTLASFARFRRLAVRHERQAGIVKAFRLLAAA